MPELDFYGDTQDERVIVEWLFANGAQLVPDIDYDVDTYAVCQDLESFTVYRLKTRHFYLLHPFFSSEPLEMRSNSRAGRSFYYIMPRNGGPALGLLLSGEFTKKGAELIGPGNVNCYPTYWSLERQANLHAPPEERSFFNKFSSWIRKNFTYTATPHRKYWIGPGARHRLQIGARLVGLEKHDLRNIPV